MQHKDKVHNTEQKPNLSQIPPLRPVEELEQAAYPGMTQRERRQEQRAHEDGNYTAEEADDLRERNVVVGAAVMPGESALMAAPSAGAIPGAVIATTLDDDDLDDQVDEGKLS